MLRADGRDIVKGNVLKTPQRRAIVHVLLEDHSHLTAEEEKWRHLLRRSSNAGRRQNDQASRHDN